MMLPTGKATKKEASSKHNMITKSSSSKEVNLKTKSKPELDLEGNNKIDNLQVELPKLRHLKKEQRH